MKMNVVYFATTNPGKVESVKRALAKYNIKVVHVFLEMPEPRSYDLQEIAKHKVLYAYDQIKKPCIVIDAGFYVWSLNGFPKSFTNFMLETIGLEGLLNLILHKDRTCRFSGCLAYYDNAMKDPKCFVYHVDGSLADAPRGRLRKSAWSPLHLLFIPSGQKKTLSEMTYKEYCKWRIKHDHAKYLNQFAEWYKKRQTKNASANNL